MSRAWRGQPGSLLGVNLLLLPLHCWGMQRWAEGMGQATRRAGGCVALGGQTPCPSPAPCATRGGYSRDHCSPGTGSGTASTAQRNFLPGSGKKVNGSSAFQRRMLQLLFYIAAGIWVLCCLSSLRRGTWSRSQLLPHSELLCSRKTRLCSSFSALILCTTSIATES